MPSIVVVKHFDNETSQQGYSGFDLECRFTPINRSDVLYDIDWVVDGVVISTTTLDNVIEREDVVVNLTGSDLVTKASNVEKVCTRGYFFK